MHSKIITLDEFFKTGEPTVQLISTRGRNGRILREKSSLHKVASLKSPALDYINSIEPEEGKSIVLVVGLGDHETYGPNRNGDGFPSKPVAGKIASDQVLPKHYQTYDKALVFEHHANTDPAKAIGRVKKAFWNPYMRRVEVLEDFSHAKAPHLLEKIASGEYPAKSMGCFLADTLIQTPDTCIPIQDITVGMCVLTHTGKTAKVTELHRRQFIGKIYSIHSACGDSTATQDHPYAVLPKEEVEEWVQAKGYWRRKPLNDINTQHIHWTPAEALNTGDYLLTPFDTTISEQTLSVEQCRLLGCYCAEGHTIYKDDVIYGIELIHNKTDAWTEEAQVLLPQLSKHAFHQNPRKNSTYAVSTVINDFTLAALCEIHVGNYAAKKQLSTVLMQQPREQQLAFLGAVIDGVGGASKSGDFYISTCNKKLAYQYQRIGFRCGLYSTLSTINHRPSTLVDKNTVEHRVDFARRGASIIAPYTTKVAEYTLKGQSTGAFFIKNYVVSKIEEIGVFDFTGPVFNFEVEEDNSYIADNHAVHNCRIKYDVCTNCGNQAPTRAHYCDHLKFAMSEIDPATGIQNAALNPSPDFFDSSWVLRPADRNGYMLKKVANDAPYEIRTSSFELGELRDAIVEKAAAIAKASELEKIVSGEPEMAMSTLDDADKKLLTNYKDSCSLDESTGTDPDMHKAVTIMISYKPSEALGTADELGLPLGIENMIRYFTQRMSGEDGNVTADAIKQASSYVPTIIELYRTYPRFFTDVIKQAQLDTPIQFNKDLATKLGAIAPKSVTQDYFYRNYIPDDLREPERARTDMVTWTDPATGQPYQTNYGAVQQTNDALVRRGLKEKALTSGTLLGAGALLGTGALALAKRRPLSALGLGTAGVGASALGLGKLIGSTPITGPKVRTDNGETISGWTEMVPKQAEAIAPELYYVRHRLLDGPHTKKGCDTALFNVLCALTMDAPHTDIVGPTLDFAKVAQALGNAILSRKA